MKDIIRFQMKDINKALFRVFSIIGIAVVGIFGRSELSELALLCLGLGLIFDTFTD